MKQKIDKRKFWYNIGDILSYKALMNFDTGGRGTGKTFSFKDWSIRDFLENGNMFAYMRRYKTELVDCDKFFDDIQSKYPEHKFKARGRTFTIDDGTKTGERIGVALPLSVAITKKSVPYPEINKMLFDEFILPPKSMIRYIPNEVFSFLEFYETVNRLRIDEYGDELPLDKLLRSFFFANNVSFINPYYMYFECFPKPGKRFTRVKDDLVVGVYDNKLFQDVKSNTRFGRLVQGTAYGDYAINNEVYLDTDEFIVPRPANSEFELTLTYDGVTVGFWFDYKNGKIYASDKYNPNGRYKFSLTCSDHKENTFLIQNASSNNMVNHIIVALRNGLLFYDNQKIKAVTMKMMSCLTTFR